MFTFFGQADDFVCERGERRARAAESGTGNNFRCGRQRVGEHETGRDAEHERSGDVDHERGRRKASDGTPDHGCVDQISGEGPDRGCDGDAGQQTSGRSDRRPTRREASDTNAERARGQPERDAEQQVPETEAAMSVFDQRDGFDRHRRQGRERAAESEPEQWPRVLCGLVPFVHEREEATESEAPLRLTANVARGNPSVGTWTTRPTPSRASAPSAPPTRMQPGTPGCSRRGRSSAPLVRVRGLSLVIGHVGPGVFTAARRQLPRLRRRSSRRASNLSRP